MTESVDTKSVHTSRLEIAYEEWGNPQGEPVILVHGFPDDVRTWDAVAGMLADAGYRALAPYVRGFGATRFLDEDTPRSGQFTALGQDILEFAESLGVEQFTLVGHDWGARAAYIAAALQPERVSRLVALAAGYGTYSPNQRPSLEQIRSYWYQWYFNLEQGRTELAVNRRGFCRRLWEIWAPGWRFDDEMFEATASSFDTPDFVEVAIHSYRHRWGEARGDPAYDNLETHFYDPPHIEVPTTVLIGADDGATLPETSADKEHLFTDSYERYVLTGVGHFIQRESPETLVQAVLGRCWNE